MGSKQTKSKPYLNAVQAPTTLSRKLVRFIIGFGVGVGLGLAPYLGQFDIPFFSPLLSLIPESVQNILLPLSAALMGTVAVVVQWYAGEKLSNTWLRKFFSRTLLLTAITFVALTLVHSYFVVTVPIQGGEESVSFLVGFSRPNKPPCNEEMSDSECIKHITLDSSKVDSYWGDRQVRFAKLLLIFSYLLFTGSFGTLIGLILLRDDTGTRRR